MYGLQKAVEEKLPALQWQYETGKAVRRSRGARFEFHSLLSMKVPDAAYSTCALEVPKALPRGFGHTPCSRECSGACVHVEVDDLVLNFAQYELFCKGS